MERGRTKGEPMLLEKRTRKAIRFRVQYDGGRAMLIKRDILRSMFPRATKAQLAEPVDKPGARRRIDCKLQELRREALGRRVERQRASVRRLVQQRARLRLEQ